MLSTFASLPDCLWPWVRCTNVITKRLMSQCDKVVMQVLDERWLMSHDQVLENRSYIGDPLSRFMKFGMTWKVIPCFKRDILMLGDENPCWFARTYIPQKSFDHDPSFFERLQHEPLSHLVYGEKRVCRTFMHSYSIDQQDIIYHWVHCDWHQNTSPLWVRYSTFHFDQHYPFYLIEVFLPALEVHS